MPSINTVILAGNLTRDPEVRYTPQGKAVAKLGLAINETYRTSDGEKKESTCFIDVEVWDRQAETAGEYLQKGAPVLVEGSLKHDTWIDRESGQKRSKHKVRARRIHFLTAGRREGSASGPDPYRVPFPKDQQVDAGDDLPPF